MFKHIAPMLLLSALTWSVPLAGARPSLVDNDIFGIRKILASYGLGGGVGGDFGLTGVQTSGGANVGSGYGHGSGFGTSGGANVGGGYGNGRGFGTSGGANVGDGYSDGRGFGTSGGANIGGGYGNGQGFGTSGGANVDGGYGNGRGFGTSGGVNVDGGYGNGRGFGTNGGANVGGGYGDGKDFGTSGRTNVGGGYGHGSGFGTSGGANVGGGYGNGRGFGTSGGANVGDGYGNGRGFKTSGGANVGDGYSDGNGFGNNGGANVGGSYGNRRGFGANGGSNVGRGYGSGRGFGASGSANVDGDYGNGRGFSANRGGGYFDGLGFGADTGSGYFDGHGFGGGASHSGGHINGRGFVSNGGTSGGGGGYGSRQNFGAGSVDSDGDGFTSAQAVGDFVNKNGYGSGYSISNGPSNKDYAANRIVGDIGGCSVSDAICSSAGLKSYSVFADSYGVDSTISDVKSSGIVGDVGCYGTKCAVGGTGLQSNGVVREVNRANDDNDEAETVGGHEADIKSGGVVGNIVNGTNGGNSKTSGGGTGIKFSEVTSDVGCSEAACTIDSGTNLKSDKDNDDINRQADGAISGFKYSDDGADLKSVAAVGDFRCNEADCIIGIGASLLSSGIVGNADRANDTIGTVKSGGGGADIKSTDGAISNTKSGGGITLKSDTVIGDVPCNGADCSINGGASLESGGIVDVANRADNTIDAVKYTSSGLDIKSGAAVNDSCCNNSGCTIGGGAESKSDEAFYLDVVDDTVGVDKFGDDGAYLKSDETPDDVSCYGVGCAFGGGAVLKSGDVVGEDNNIRSGSKSVNGSANIKAGGIGDYISCSGAACAVDGSANLNPHETNGNINRANDSVGGLKYSDDGTNLKSNRAIGDVEGSHVSNNSLVKLGSSGLNIDSDKFVDEQTKLAVQYLKSSGAVGEVDEAHIASRVKSGGSGADLGSGRIVDEQTKLAVQYLQSSGAVGDVDGAHVASSNGVKSGGSGVNIESDKVIGDQTKLALQYLQPSGVVGDVDGAHVASNDVVKSGGSGVNIEPNKV